MKIYDESGELYMISLRAARVNKGLSTAEVARELRVSTNSVSKWETGAVKPTLATAKMLCELYDVDIYNIKEFKVNKK